MYNPEQSAVARHAALLVAKREYDPSRYPDLIEILAEQLVAAEEMIESYNRSTRAMARSQHFSLHGRVFEFKGLEPEAPELPPEKPSAQQQRFERMNAALKPARSEIARLRTQNFDKWLEEHLSEELKAKRDELRVETAKMRRQFDREVIGVRNTSPDDS